MSALARAQDVHTRLLRDVGSSGDVGPILKKLPSGLRRMGLIRTLEWLETGRDSSRGVAIFHAMAPELRLLATISETVNHLESCPRRDYFDTQRRALELVDALAIIHRISDAGGRS